MAFRHDAKLHAKLANIFPQTWVLKTIDSLQQGKSFNEVISYLSIVILFALAFFVVGILKLTKDENLKVFLRYKNKCI